MRIDLAISSYTITGPGSEHAPARHHVPLPPPGTKRKGGRLPLLAGALAELITQRTDTSACVLIGTALGCLTETRLFVEHMIEAEEATPKPRAFASSVHNAIASRVALELDAQGECQTFVQGEVSFVHALFAAGMARRRTAAPIYVGAIDETCSYVDRALEHCGRPGVERPAASGEGGALLLADGAGPARISRIAFDRPTHPAAWLTDQMPEPGAIVLVPALDGTTADIQESVVAPFATHHPSLIATATALAAGVIEGAVPPAALGLDHPPTAAGITLLVRSRFGDCGAVHIEA